MESKDEVNTCKTELSEPSMWQAGAVGVSVVGSKEAVKQDESRSSPYTLHCAYKGVK